MSAQKGQQSYDLAWDTCPADPPAPDATLDGRLFAGITKIPEQFSELLRL
jgi:hypothetical protein